MRLQHVNERQPAGSPTGFTPLPINSVGRLTLTLRCPAGLDNIERLLDEGVVIFF